MVDDLYKFNVHGQTFFQTLAPEAHRAPNEMMVHRPVQSIATNSFHKSHELTDNVY
ncbi:hypothetical protein GcC1_167012 [Golovinomyces cichoracearum]|uniref:Uncharacterized protein n=1 Tax=Golovinomyces cichoracearum TaxID=62708 RepID=A0A420HSA6_9PEZI|nr:hypothetical protein GcC1_167012 [Golovinomyces cichoracearum]